MTGSVSPTRPRSKYLGQRVSTFTYITNIFFNEYKDIRVFEVLKEQSVVFWGRNVNEKRRTLIG